MTLYATEEDYEKAKTAGTTDPITRVLGTGRNMTTITTVFTNSTSTSRSSSRFRSCSCWTIRWNRNWCYSISTRRSTIYVTVSTTSD